MYPLNEIDMNVAIIRVYGNNFLPCNVCLGRSPSPSNVSASQGEWQSPAPFLVAFDHFSAGTVEWS